MVSQSENYQIPATRALYVQHAAELFAKQGLDLASLLYDAVLPENLSHRQHKFVPTLSLSRLMYAGAAQLGEHTTIEVLRELFREYCVPSVLPLFQAYPTMAAALDKVSEIFTLDSPGSAVFIEHKQGEIWFCRKAFAEPAEELPWHEPFVALYLIELVQALTNRPWKPSKFKSQGTQTRLLEQIVDSPCQWYIGQPHTAIALPKELLDQPLHNLPAKVLDEFEPWHTTFTGSVIELLESYASEQPMPIEAAANILGYSPRTLQRKLKAENATYNRVKDSVMYAKACELMEQGMSLTNIASQLGYQNLSHFSRAFKRVAGMPPAAYQKALRDKK